MDFTPDCVVTKKKRGKIGTPISANTRSVYLKPERMEKGRTERFRLVPLIIFPKSELQDGFRGEILLHQRMPI